MEQFADTVRLFDRVAQRPFGIDLVVVATANFCSIHVATSHEIRDDRLSSALGNPDPSGDISATDAGVTRNANQYMAMVGKERPALFRLDLGSLFR